MNKLKIRVPKNKRIYFTSKRGTQYIIKNDDGKLTVLKRFTEEPAKPTQEIIDSIQDSLEYTPEVKPGMGIQDFEDIVHTTITYIRKKYPNEHNTMDKWITLIGEEFGELCRAINDGDINNTLEEATQCIAAIYLMMEEFVQSQSAQPAMINDKSLSNQIRESIIDIIAPKFCEKHKYNEADVRRLLKVKTDAELQALAKSLGVGNQVALLLEVAKNK